MFWSRHMFKCRATYLNDSLPCVAIMRIRQTLLAKWTMPALYRVQRPDKLRFRNFQIKQRVDSCSSESDTGKDRVKTQSTNNQLLCI